MERFRKWPPFAQFLGTGGRLGVPIILVGSLTLYAVRGAERMTQPANPNPPATKTETLAASESPIELGTGAVTCTLSPPAGQQRTKLASRLNSLAPGERIYLVLRDMTTDQQPGVLYHVYLNLPPGNNAPAKDDPHYVGVLNFFSASGKSSPAAFRSFDVTDLLRNLEKQNLLSDQTMVTIIPSRGGAFNTNAKPVIGRIELVVQAASS